MDPSAVIERTTLPVEGEGLPVTVVRGAGRGAALVVVPSGFGVATDVVEQMTELAADASLVVAMDPFFRDAPGVVPYGDMPTVMKRLQGLDRERFYRDLRAVLDWARRASGGRPLVVVGVCFGGTFALRAAADDLIDGAVSWHGGRMETLAGRAGEVKVPLRLHFGAVDPVVPMAAVEALRAAFAGRDEVRIFVHEGATHGFSHRSAPQAYDAAAEKAGMASVRELVRSVERRRT